MRAFGMDVDAGFQLVGVAPSEPLGDGRELSLELASRAEVEKGFPADAERIATLERDGELLVTIDAAGEQGYLAWAFDFGHARISADGRRVLVAPLDSEPPWVWQRYLTGQVLPLAALLQGLEVFHASVLGLDGRAVAVVAPSGVGKTTTALTLARRGLDFLSDDVLLLEPAGEGVRVHPGIGLANVRPGAEQLLSDLEEMGLARPVGQNERETRIAIRRAGEALPLGAFVVLARFVEQREIRVDRLAPVEPRILLASTFNFSVQSAERLARQLEVCARIERSAPVFRISCGGDVTPDAVADAILEHAADPTAC